MRSYICELTLGLYLYFSASQNDIPIVDETEKDWNDISGIVMLLRRLYLSGEIFCN